MCMTCHQNVPESVAQLKDTDHTRSYDTKNTPVLFTATVSQVSRSSPVGRSRSALCLCCRHQGRLSHSLLMPDLVTVSLSVTECRPVKFSSSGNS